MEIHTLHVKKNAKTLSKEFGQAVSLFSSNNSPVYRNYLKQRYQDYTDRYIKYNVQLYLPKLTLRSDSAFKEYITTIGYEIAISSVTS